MEKWTRVVKRRRRKYAYTSGLLKKRRISKNIKRDCQRAPSPPQRATATSKTSVLNLPSQVYFDARGAVVCCGGEGDVEVLGVVQGSHLDRVFQDDVLGLAVVAKVGLGQDLEKQEWPLLSKRSRGSAQA